MNVWHHLRFAGDEDPSYQVYAKNVKLIAPLLQQLTLKGVYVVWMINQPTFDFAYFLKRAEDIEEIFIHNEKVFQFNRVARAILSKVCYNNNEPFK